MEAPNASASAPTTPIVPDVVGPNEAPAPTLADELDRLRDEQGDPAKLTDAQIRKLHKAADADLGALVRAVRSYALTAYRIGRALAARKSTTKRGQYTPWITETLGIPDRTARRYRFIHDGLETLVARNGQYWPLTILDLPVDKLEGFIRKALKPADGRKDKGKQDKGKQDKGKQDKGKEKGKQDKEKRAKRKQHEGKQDKGKQNAEKKGEESSRSADHEESDDSRTERNTNADGDAEATTKTTGKEADAEQRDGEGSGSEASASAAGHTTIPQGSSVLTTLRTVGEILSADIPDDLSTMSHEETKECAQLVAIIERRVTHLKQNLLRRSRPRHNERKRETSDEHRAD